MTGSYNPALVCLSLAVAVLASYAMLEIAARVCGMALDSPKRPWWLAGGAVAVGNGIWSMHFIGMVAWRMPVEIGYEPVRTMGSWAFALLASYIALHLTARSELTGIRLVRGGLVMGLGIAGMHFLGMSAMRMTPAFHYRAGVVLLSVGIAVVVSSAALWMTLSARGGTSGQVLRKRLGASLVMGVAVAGMHYVGMSAIVMPAMVRGNPGSVLGNNLLVVLVSLFSMGGLAMVLVLSMLDGRIVHLLTEAADATAGQRLLKLSGLDPVTGIGTRATFILEIEQKMAEARRDGKLLGLVFLDLDGFKTINDSLGYTGGDAVLRAFSDDLQRRIRANTTMGRMGADEFALVLDGLDAPERAELLARSILERMKTEFEIEGVTLRVTASAGVALYPRDGQNVDTLLKNACVAKQHAKQAGKSSFRVYDVKMSDAASRSTEITRGLGEALAHSQFSLVFQPKFDGKGTRISGAEALIRWTHPVLGSISPMDFIPLAEQTGQIIPISEWVIGEVCRQMNLWGNQGLPPIRVAINLSPEQLRLSGYAERVSAMVRQAGIDPRMILFEITETAAMREPKLATVAIAEFQSAGFDFAIDDFGTGYSSMAYLQQFRVKELKIDRFFVGSLEDGPEGHTIVAAIIALAHALHMTVVAEGVETASQLKELNGMDCDEVQGYLLGRPLTPMDFEKLLRGEAERDELAGIGRVKHEVKTGKARLRSAIA